MRFCCSTSSSRTLASFRSAQDFACMATNRDISQLVFFDPKPLKDFEDWKTRRPGGAGSEVSGSPPLPLWQSTNAATLCSYSCEEPVPFIRLLLFIPLPLLFIRAPLPLMPGPLLFIPRPPLFMPEPDPAA